MFCYLQKILGYKGYCLIVNCCGIIICGGYIVISNQKSASNICIHQTEYGFSMLEIYIKKRKRSREISFNLTPKDEKYFKNIIGTINNIK